MNLPDSNWVFHRNIYDISFPSEIPKAFNDMRGSGALPGSSEYMSTSLCNWTTAIGQLPKVGHHTVPQNGLRPPGNRWGYAFRFTYRFAELNCDIQVRS